MPLRVNGDSIPWAVVLAVITAVTIAAGGLVRGENTEARVTKIEGQQETIIPKLSRDEARIEANERAIREIKDSILRQEQKLDRFLEKLNESRK